MNKSFKNGPLQINLAIYNRYSSLSANISSVLGPVVCLFFSCVSSTVEDETTAAIDF